MVRGRRMLPPSPNSPGHFRVGGLHATKDTLFPYELPCKRALLRQAPSRASSWLGGSILRVGCPRTGLGPGAEGPLRATPRDGPRHMPVQAARALREPRLAAQFKLAATPVWGRLPVRPRAAQPHGQRSGQYPRLVCATTAAAFSAFILDGRPRRLRPH
jgi:hypothetical protein